MKTYFDKKYRVETYIRYDENDFKLIDKPEGVLHLEHWELTYLLLALSKTYGDIFEVEFLGRLVHGLYVSDGSHDYLMLIEEEK